MTKLGMDAGTMDALVRQMQTQTRSITTIVARVDRLVYQIDAEWDGPKARAFVADWRARYRPALLRAHDHVAGLATSASNNIAEQRGTSRVGERHAVKVDVGRVVGLLGDVNDLVSMRMTMIGILTSSVALKSMPIGKVTIGNAWKMLAQGDKLSSLSKYGKTLKGLSFVGAGFTAFELVDDIRKGESVGTIVGDVVEGGIVAAGFVFPPVGLAYGAWSVGTFIGEGIANTSAFQSLADTANDAILREGSRHVGGDPTTSPTAAAELTRRYSGPMGPIHYGKDWFGAVLHNR